MKHIIALCLLVLISHAHAGEKEIKLSLKKSFPGISQIDQIAKSPYSGLYEVVIDGQLLYTDANGQYVFDGTIIEAATRRNVTEERRKVLFAIDFNQLPLELAIKKVKGNGKRKMAQFTDPNCSFCQRLEKEFVNIDNVTIYSFLYPIFPGSDEIVRNVLCSKDPVLAWDNWMLNKTLPEQASCETQTDKVKALGQKLRVNGTPNLIFASGVQSPGYLPAAELEHHLDGVAKK